MFKFINKITAYFFWIISTEACYKTEMSSLQTSPARTAGPPSQGWFIPGLSCSVVHYSVSAPLQTNRKQIISLYKVVQRYKQAKYNATVSERKLLCFYLLDACYFQYSYQWTSVSFFVTINFDPQFLFWCLA